MHTYHLRLPLIFSARSLPFSSFDYNPRSIHLEVTHLTFFPKPHLWHLPWYCLSSNTGSDLWEPAQSFPAVTRRTLSSIPDRP